MKPPNNLSQSARLGSVLVVYGLVFLSFSAYTARADTPNGDVSAFVQDHVGYANAMLQSASCVAGLHAKSCRQRFEKLADRILNFHQLTLRATRGLTLQEPTADFAKRFRKLLVHQWKSRLTGEPDVKLTVLSVTHTEARVQVNTVDAVWELGLALTHDGNRFWVVDVVVDDLSLANHYRKGFADVLARENWDGLLKKMADRARP